MHNWNVILCAIIISVAAVQSDVIVFDDTLQNFQDWTGTWSTVNKQVTNPKYAGTYSIGVTMPAYAGFYLAQGNVDLTTYWALQFWIHGGSTGGQDISIAFNPNASPASAALPVASYLVSGTTIPKSWVQVIIPFRSAYSAVQTGTITEFWFQNNLGTSLGTFYIDNMSFLSGPAPSPSPPPSPPPVYGSTVTVNVDTTQNIRAINPMVYGVNSAKSTHLASLPYPINRRGGNAETAYNWQSGVSNRALDWYFLSVGDSLSGPAANVPEGTELTQFVDQTVAANATTLLTASTIGYAALDIPSNNRGLQRWSYSVAKYGAQQQYNGDAGRGVLTSGTQITWNDRNDTYKIVDKNYVVQLMQFLNSRGTPVKYWSMDNEVDLWSSTHVDKWGTTGISYNQFWNMTTAYAAAIKQQDSSVKIFGPVSYGYCGWFYSRADGDGCNNGLDKQNNGGGLDFLVWYAKKVCEYKQQTGVLLVDYLDVHFYPERISDTIVPALSSFDDATNRGYRFRTLKGLYDPTYREENWIGTAAHPYLYFIPYLRNLTATMCPDMKIAITEYNWGNDDIISGAVATAEALAIFGREGVDIATRWVVPEVGTLGEQAFRIYLNYDGQGGSVANGGYSVKATSSNVDLVGSYAIHVPSKNKLFVYLFNKYVYNNASTSVKITMNNGLTPTGDAQLYRFDSYRFLELVGTSPISNLQFTVNTTFCSATVAVVSLLPSGASPSASPVAGVSPSRTPSVSPSRTPSPSASPAAASSSTSPSRTPSSSPSVTPSRSPSNSPSSTPTRTPSVTPSKSPSASVSSSPGSSVTPTSSPSPAAASPSSSPTKTPSNSPTRTPSITPSRSPSSGASASSSPAAVSTSPQPSTVASNSPAASSQVSASPTPEKRGKGPKNNSNVAIIAGAVGGTAAVGAVAAAAVLIARRRKHHSGASQVAMAEVSTPN